jgi:hypothetical protein
MAADGPALLAAAVRAACLAKAPRRTIQAVAAAVAGVLARPATMAATPREASSARAGDMRNAADAGNGFPPEELLAALRAARSAQRRRKKVRRRTAKRVAVAASHNEASVAAETHDDMDVTSALETAVPALPLPEARQNHDAQESQDKRVARLLGIRSDDGSSIASTSSRRSSMAVAVKRPSPDDREMLPPPNRPRRAGGRGRGESKPSEGGAASQRPRRGGR